MYRKEVHERVCLRNGCRRVSVKATCWFHRVLSGDNATDPGTSPDSQFWWESVMPRYRQLQAIADNRRIPWRTRDVASAEQRRLREVAFELWAPVGGQIWRRESHRPEWRLPPDGWLFDRFQKEFPELQWSRPVPWSGGDYRDPKISAWMDLRARKLHSIARKAPAPFRPSDEYREEDDEAIIGLRRQQQTNLPVFARYIPVIAAHKAGHGVSGMGVVCSDPDADLRIPPDTVVYHQIGSSSVSANPQALATHLALEIGDVVYYNHIRCATMKTWWFGSLYGRPRWLNQDGNETGLRLELAPLRGIYIDEEAGHLVGSGPLHEKEVVLPAGTYWEVLGIADVINLDKRQSPHSLDRLRAVQMREITRSQIDGRIVTPMTIDPRW